MGKIIVPVHIANWADPEKRLICDALVDTGSSYMVLPSAWRERLGDLPEIRRLRMRTATQEAVAAIICAPVSLQIEGFPQILCEIAFVDMEPINGSYAPLLGYIPLEQSQAAVDMLAHQLVYVEAMDLK